MMFGLCATINELFFTRYSLSAVQLHDAWDTYIVCPPYSCTMFGLCTMLNVQLQFIRKKKNLAARLVKSGYKRGGTGMGSPSKILTMARMHKVLLL